MASRYLKLCRHGITYHFRRRVPDDLRPSFGKNYLTRSLMTDSRRQAMKLARVAAAETDALFDRLRAMSNQKNSSNSDSLNVLFLKWKHRRTLETQRDEFEAELELERARHRQEIDEFRTRAREATLRAHTLGMKQVIAQGVLPSPAATNVVEPAVPCNRGSKPTAMTIMQVFDEFKALQIAIGAQADSKGGWSNPKRVDVEQTVHIRAFIEFLEGDCPIEEVSDDDVMAFNDFVMTTDTIKSASMRKQRLNRTAAAFKYAKKKRYIQNAYTEEFKFAGKIKKNPFLKFTNADLRALFESDAYRNHQHQTSSQYWLPLLGLHTGARINELCQLLRSDIKEIDGVPVISILDEEEGKRLKTEASRRNVPIHSKLVELGFLDFVRTIPKGRIFPHLREDPNKPGDFGQKATDDFTEYRRSVGVGKRAGEGKSNKAFHSFRSTFISAMRHALPDPVPKDRRTRLVGHEYDDTHDDTYNGGDVLDMFPVATLKRDIESVRFEIDFTPYRPR